MSTDVPICPGVSHFVALIAKRTNKPNSVAVSVGVRAYELPDMPDSVGTQGRIIKPLAASRELDHRFRKATERPKVEARCFAGVCAVAKQKGVSPRRIYGNTYPVGNFVETLVSW